VRGNIFDSNGIHVAVVNGGDLRLRRAWGIDEHSRGLRGRIPLSPRRDDAATHNGRRRAQRPPR
jgi:hypothetical protein